jgi:hypothetical protein
MATCATRLQSVASSAPGVPWRVRTTLVFGAATPPAFAQACACPSGTTLGAQRALAGPGRPHSARAARGAGGGAAARRRGGPRAGLAWGAATPPAFAQACACPSGTTLGAQRALAGPGRPHSARAARGAGGGAATSTHPQQAAQHHTHSAYNLLHDNSTCA